MALRFPMQVRRSPAIAEQIRSWEKHASAKRGAESKKAAQRLKELHRLELLFARKPFLGRNVPKNLIPKKYSAQGVTNLFRNDLPDGWRMLHTVMEVDAEQAVIELEALTHRDYDKLFGYDAR